MYKQNEYEGWPTTRRYPRTLAEAFPQDSTHDWFEPPPPRRKSNAVLFWSAVALWVGVIYLVAWLS
jgi:hypothetical protein